MPLLRVATRADAGALAALRYEFRSGLAEARETRAAFVARASAWMEARLGDSDSGSGWRCWVAEDSGAVVGNVWLLAIDKLPNPVAEPERHAYVSNLYVRPAARGNGVGSRLLEQALTWCREAQVDAVILWPTPESRSLYARHGFANAGDVLELRAR
jgi:GNAT superfamily N-acetyltransferase